MKEILLINFLTMLTFNMAHPVTPLLINTIGLPSYTFGVLYSTMAIAQFAMSPIFGSLSDCLGRRRFMMIGLMGYGIGQLGFGFSKNIFTILFFRFFAGCFSVAFLTSCIAYISDISSKEDRIKYMSYHTASTAIGSSFGALIGGYFGKFGYKSSFIVQFIFSVATSIFVYFIIKETIKDKKDISINFNHLKMRSSINYKDTLGIMMIVVVLVTFSITSYNSTINYYVETVLNLPTTINGIIMSFAGILALITNIFINPYLGKKFDERKTIKVVLCVCGTSIIIASLSKNIYISLVFLSLFILSSASITPMQQSIVSKIAKDNYGEIMGLQGSFKALGMVSGSLISGFIFDFGNRLPFIFAGISCIIAFLVLSKKLRKI